MRTVSQRAQGQEDHDLNLPNYPLENAQDILDPAGIALAQESNDVVQSLFGSGPHESLSCGFDCDPGVLLVLGAQHHGRPPRRMPRTPRRAPPC